MDRAYSLLTIKSVDAERRVITGIATTPTADRMGDVIEPLGVQFKNPLPLLLFHDSKKPVGQTRFKKPTAAGIEFEATLANVTEPGALKDRIDEAWQSVKAGLIQGVSIGFRAIETAFLKDTGGIRFLKSEVVELSLVTVPANAQASIHTIKSLDAPVLLNTGATSSSTFPPAAVGTRTKDATMTTTLPAGERLSAISATLKTKSARLEELITKDGADGGLEDGEQTELTSIRGEVEKLTGQVKNLQALQESQSTMAQPVRVKAPDVDVRGSSMQATDVGQNTKSQLAPGQEFAQYIICRMAALKYGGSPMEYAKTYYKDQPRIQWLIKDNIPAGTTSDNLFAAPLVNPQTLTNEFIEFLRPQTIIGRIPGLRRVPFNVRITGQTSGGTGYWVGQGQSKPLTRFGTSATTLTWAKVAAIIAITDELARFSNPSAELLVRDELAACLRERLDIDFVDPTKAAVANVSPASITNGVTNLNDTGTSLANAMTDVAQFFNAMINNNIDLTGCVWIMPSTVALQLSLMVNSLGVLAFPTISATGGTWMGLPVITSQYMLFSHTPANNKVILVSAPDIFLSDDGGFTVDISREASLEMDDQPVMASTSAAGSPSGPTGSALVSMFQTNSIAIRCERYINWAKRRTTAVVWMDDVRWAA